MKIGIISDTHDNIWNLEKVLKILKEKGIEKLIHCGDFCAGFSILQLTDTGIDTHIVWGNTNDKEQTKKMVEEKENLTLHGDVGELIIEGKKIAFTHFPDKAEELANTGKYNIVFHGHTHKKEEKKINNTRIINPGEVMGKNGKPSFATYDTETDEVEFFQL